MQNCSWEHHCRPEGLPLEAAMRRGLLWPLNSDMLAKGTPRRKFRCRPLPNISPQ